MGYMVWRSGKRDREKEKEMSKECGRCHTVVAEDSCVHLGCSHSFCLLCFSRFDTDACPVCGTMHAGVPQRPAPCPPSTTQSLPPDGWDFVNSSEVEEEDSDTTFAWRLQEEENKRAGVPLRARERKDATNATLIGAAANGPPLGSTLRGNDREKCQSQSILERLRSAEVPSPQHKETDVEMARRLQEEENGKVRQPECRPRVSPPPAEADIELARRLQEEENKRAGVPYPPYQHPPLIRPFSTVPIPHHGALTDEQVALQLARQLSQEDSDRRRLLEDQVCEDERLARGMESALIDHFTDLDFAVALRMEEQESLEEEQQALRRRLHREAIEGAGTPCQVCMQDVRLDSQEGIYLYSCSHFVCLRCLRQSVVKETEENSMASIDCLECPVPGCECLLTVREVSPLLGPDQLEVLKKRSGLKSVFELLYCMLRVAAASDRWQAILTPFPLQPPSTIDTLRAVLTSMADPEPRALLALPQPSRRLRAQLQDYHPQAAELFGFMCGSAEAYSLVKIGDVGDRLTFMDTPHQFLIPQHPRNAQFAEHRRRWGSKFAYHGSRPENWFSILHGGIRNASGTSLQLNGAAHGKGVYLSPAAAVSNAYSALSGSRKDYNAGSSYVSDVLDVDSFRCIAICEVIDRDLKIATKDIWVQPHEEYVAVRFLCVYQHGCSIGATVRLDEQTTMDSLLKMNISESYRESKSKKIKKYKVA